MSKPYLGKAAYTYETRRKGKEIWVKEDSVMRSILERQDNETRILDIPVGTGRFLGFYKAAGMKAVGFDLSPDMLKIARKRFPNTRLEIANVKKIPIADKSVELSVCIRLLYFLNLGEVKVALSELARVTRNLIVFSVRFTHQGGPKARKVITHDWKEFRKLIPTGWNIVKRHTINDLPSDKYVICEMEPVK